MQATWLFTLLSVPLLLVVPLLVALLMNGKFPGRTVFRALYFAPYVLGVAVVSVLWRYLLDGNIGLVNYYAGALGLPDARRGSPSCRGPGCRWSSSRSGGRSASTPSSTSPRCRRSRPTCTRRRASTAPTRGSASRRVTLPGLRPVIVFVTSVTLIASVNMFGQSWLMTQGGPGTETRTAIYQIADTGLTNFTSGAASAMSTLFTVSLILVNIVVFLLLRERTAAPKGARR